MLVKVHNRNVYPFEQVFKGQKVFIKPNDYIEMDYMEAVEFKSLYYPIKKDKGGLQDPKTYKWIEIDEADTKKFFKSLGNQTDERKEKFVCHVCSKDFLTKNGLMAHIKKNHLSDMMDEDARDELIDNEEV